MNFPWRMPAAGVIRNELGGAIYGKLGGAVFKSLERWKAGDPRSSLEVFISYNTHLLKMEVYVSTWISNIPIPARDDPIWHTSYSSNGLGTQPPSSISYASLSTWISKMGILSSLQWPIESPENKEDHGLLVTNTKSFIGMTTTKLTCETVVDPWCWPTIVSPIVLMVQKSGDHQLIW